MGLHMVFFQGSRGIRQGDPLSPLLFILVMEVLSKFISKAMDANLLEGFSVGDGIGTISHLLFADDALFFSGINEDSMISLKGILLCFEAVSGLKVNLGKSELIPVGRVDNLEILANIFCCKISKLPITYLGLPLGARFKDPKVWDLVIALRWKEDLVGGKKGYLSKGGKVTLIQSVLSIIPIYFMSIHKIPLSVANRIEKLQRDFLWNGMGGEHKYHLVDWKSICLPKSLGGLGIRSISRTNQALMGKWLWRFGNGEQGLWRDVVVWKYGTTIEGWWPIGVLMVRFGSVLGEILNQTIILRFCSSQTKTKPYYKKTKPNQTIIFRFGSVRFWF